MRLSLICRRPRLRGNARRRPGAHDPASADGGAARGDGAARLSERRLARAGLER